MSDGPAQRGRIKPEPLYLILSGGYALLFNIVMSVNLLFQTQEAGLNPFQLVLVGTVLEGSRFVFEVPTGVVADLVSRRLSILVGMLLVGAGLALGGAFTMFETILVAQVIWGLGYTFISGAKEAWIADELGADHIGKVFLRSAQVEQIARIVAIPVATAIALAELRLPILIGGGLFFPFALFLALTMPEQGFRRPSGGHETFRTTFLAGARVVRGSPLLITILCLAGLYGMASEGFSRLWIAHFFENIGFPSVGGLEPVVWIGLVRIGSALLGIGAVELIRRRLDVESHRAISRALFLIYALQLASFVTLGFAGGFVVGMVAFWGVVSLNLAYAPLYLTWLNQNIDSGARATVISMNSQVDSLGQVVGGPPLGAIGALIGLRAALLCSAAVMLPGLLLYARALGQGQRGGKQATGATPDA